MPIIIFAFIFATIALLSAGFVLSFFVFVYIAAILAVMAIGMFVYIFPRMMAELSLIGSWTMALLRWPLIILNFAGGWLMVSALTGSHSAWLMRLAQIVYRPWGVSLSSTLAHPGGKSLFFMIMGFQLSYVVFLAGLGALFSVVGLLQFVIYWLLNVIEQRTLKPVMLIDKAMNERMDRVGAAKSIAL